MAQREDDNAAQPLVMRHYRRHRRQAKWGTWSLFVPLLTLLWAIFWYLMMKRPSLPDGIESDTAWMWMAMLIGIAVIEAAGCVIAIIGLLDTYHKHAHSAAGLAINAFIFVAVVIVLFMRWFANSV